MQKQQTLTADAKKTIKSLERSNGYTKSTASAGRNIHQGYKYGSEFNSRYKEYNFFLGNYPDAKKYPTIYEADINMRFTVLSKDTYEGEYFMGACIAYELYTEEEIKKYFDKEFEEHIMPIVNDGKERLKQDLEYFFDGMFEEEIQNVVNKLKE